MTAVKDRDLYQARVTLPDGRRPAKYFKSKKEAWEWVNAMLVDAHRGVAIVESNDPVGTLLDDWLQTVAVRNVRPNTLYNYERALGYARPFIGAVKLKDLTRQHMERAFSALESGNGCRPLARSTQNYVFHVLKQALEYAVDCELVPRNPMDRMKAPRLGGAKDTVLSLEACRRILADTAGTRWHALFWLLATTGMRISECLGIEWKNVDLATGMIRLERQAIQVHGRPGVHLEPLKTESSRRTVQVPPIVCAILRHHRSQQAEEEAAARARGGWEGQGTVFCTVTGKLYARNTAGQQFRDIRSRLDLGEDVTLHTFRHTVATLLQESGHPLRAAQVLLGHATDATTLRVYSHPTPETLERIAATMGTMFAPGERETSDGESQPREPLLPDEV